MRKFSTTIGYTGESKVLVNSDRILYVEELSDPRRYVVHFDNQETREIDEISGKVLIANLRRDGEWYIPTPQLSFSPTPRTPRRMR